MSDNRKTFGLLKLFKANIRKLKKPTKVTPSTQCLGVTCLEKLFIIRRNYFTNF